MSSSTTAPENQSKNPPLPAFLRQPRSEIQNKFVDLEWQQRERLHEGLQTTAGDNISQWARATGDDVFKRNRYFNVEPFDSKRIHLKVPDGQSDYINASPIRLPVTKTGKEKYFIATQGPKEDSYSHIWRMIWHETADPAVIIMLTQTHESGREKCFQYYPASPTEDQQMDINEQDEFKDNFLATLTLVNLTEDPATRSTIREMELKLSNGQSKKVWHFLFEGWPDFLVPEGADREALMELVTLSAQRNSVNDSPRVVHCSAGVGRSGTFIALDWLMGELEDGSFDHLPDDADPIADVVDTLRQQRMMMVQGESQFHFLYTVLKEKWIERWQRLHHATEVNDPCEHRAKEAEGAEELGSEKDLGGTAAGTGR